MLNSKQKLVVLTPKLNKLAEKLRTQLYNTNVLIKDLQAFYDFLDKFNNLIPSGSTCKKGCSHCCKRDIQITSIEAQYISFNTELSHNLFPSMSLSTGNTSNCPFLDSDETCSIYPLRPIVCRILFSYEPVKNCSLENTDPSFVHYGSPVHGFSHPFIKNVLEWFHDQNQYAGGHINDIRTFF